MTAAVICLLGDRQYAIPVADILEVAAMVHLTPLPESAPELLGLANRHGEVLPILDLRLCLGHDASPTTMNTLFVVVRDADMMAGLVVDDIREVAQLPAETSKPPAHSGPYVKEVAILNEQPVLVLNVQAILRAFAPTDLGVESDA
ncbi:MAG: chemotaxis protein CheW [Anaerolineae bacterium]